MDLEDDLPLRDDAFRISPKARQNLAVLKKLAHFMQEDMKKMGKDGPVLYGSAQANAFRREVGLRIQELSVRMEDILENRAPDGAITRLTSEMIGDYMAAIGIIRAAELVAGTFRFHADLFSEE